MRTTRDASGRFPERPFYTERELDDMFEHIVTSFLRQRRNAIAFPLTTDDLTVLIEEDVSDLDLYADLSGYGSEVEGMTKFEPGSKPHVAIAAELSESSCRENRLRTTLAHEYGHVRLHADLYDLYALRRPLFDQRHEPVAIYCKRATILSAKQSDWMEWQAGYACGAILMPRSYVQRIVREQQETRHIFGAVRDTSSDGIALIKAVAESFRVSNDAARIRLLRLGVLGEPVAAGSLFG